MSEKDIFTQDELNNLAVNESISVQQEVQNLAIRNLIKLRQMLQTDLLQDFARTLLRKHKTANWILCSDAIMRSGKWLIFWQEEEKIILF